MSRQKIIILEGRDRLGKSTCVQHVIKKYENAGWHALSIFSGPQENTFRDVGIRGDHWASAYTSNQLMPDFMSTSYETIGYFIKKLFDLSTVTRDTVLIIDRLHLSSYVYGTTLRREQFELLHQSIDNYLEYQKKFEEYLMSIAEVEQYVFVADDTTDESDDENPRRHMSADEINMINVEFYKAIELTQLSTFLFVCKRDSTGYYDTETRFLEFLENVEIPKSSPSMLEQSILQNNK